MKIKSQRDFVSGLMFIVVGVIFAVGATNYSMGSSAKPGAGYFPLILSVIMAILGVPPGRVVGAAREHMLAVRMEHGPLPREQAEAELRAWAAAQGFAPDPGTA